MGNATIGMKYYRPTNYRHPRDTIMDIDSSTAPVDTNIGGVDTTIDVTTYDTASAEDSQRKLYPQTRYIDGLQPELQLFSTGRKYGWDVDFMLDGYRNDWLSGTNPGGLRANMFNLKLSGKDQQVTIGDFFQSGSEIYVSSKKVFGLKYETDLMEMGRGGQRFKLTALGGETERSLAIDDHNPDVPNDTIKQGFAVRQQMMGMGRLSAFAAPGLTIGAQVIHARDLKESILRSLVEDSDTTANKPIQGTTAGLDLEYRFHKDQLVLRMEGAGGYADSLDMETFEPRGRGSLAWKDAAAGSFGLGAEIGKYTGDISFTTVRPKYYSGGNPYLTQDQHQGKVTGSAMFSENTSADMEYELTLRNASYPSAEDIASKSSFGKAWKDSVGLQTAPMQNRVTLSSKHKFIGDLPEISFNYTFYLERYQKNDKGDGIDSAAVAYQETTYVTDATSGEILDTIYADTTWDSTYSFSFVAPSKMSDLKNTIGFGVKQPIPFLKNSNVKLDYRIQIQRDLGDYVADSLEGQKNSLQNQISGVVTTNHGKLAQSRFTAKYKTKSEVKSDRVTNGYEVSERLGLNIIPRKLRLTLDGSYRKDYNEEDAESGRESTLATAQTAGMDLKYTISNKLSTSLTANYEKNYDETTGTPNFRVIYGGLSMTYVF